MLSIYIYGHREMSAPLLSKEGCLPNSAYDNIPSLKNIFGMERKSGGTMPCGRQGRWEASRWSYLQSVCCMDGVSVHGVTFIISHNNSTCWKESRDEVEELGMGKEVVGEGARRGAQGQADAAWERGSPGRRGDRN